MPLNCSIAGKTYEGVPVEITSAAAMFYALAVGDLSPSYLDGGRPGGIVAPPMFGAVAARGPVRAALLDPAVGISYDSLFHYRQTFHWLSPLWPGDTISTRATVADVRCYETGGIVDIDTVSINQKGDPVLLGNWCYFDSSAGKQGCGRPDKTTPRTGPVVFETVIEVPPFQPFVYAEASGDKNPLHVDNDHAKQRGLSGVIVHGFCTMALCYRAVTDALCGRTFEGVKTLSVRFAKPVFPGETLVISGIRADGEPSTPTFGITALNRDKKAVIHDGFCVLQ